MTSILTRLKNLIHSPDLMGWLDAEFVKEKNLLVDTLADKFGPQIATFIHDMESSTLTPEQKLFEVAENVVKLATTNGIAGLLFGAAVQVAQTMFDQLAHDTQAAAVKVLTQEVAKVTTVVALPSVLSTKAAGDTPDQPNTLA